ncbi:MAG: amidohydrolase family protein [Bryobacteraceae bacterium]
MARVKLIRGARQLLTLRGPGGPRRGADLRSLAIIQDGAVLIADGWIVEVGPSRRLENLALARQAEVIDASGCVVMPGFVDSDVPLIRNAQDLSPRALKTLALHRIEDAIRCGTTAIEATSGPGLTEAGALKVLRIHAALRELPLTLVSTLVTSDEHLLAMPRIRRLADFVEICRDDTALLGQALQLGWSVKPRDVIALNPVQPFLANEPYPDARALIDSGAAVALTSGANTQTAIALACRAMNMTPAEAVAASTINGAHAIGRARSVGSIEAGKSADLTILGLPDYRELPYHLGVNLVNLVMIRGSVRVERSEVKWPDR